MRLWARALRLPIPTTNNKSKWGGSLTEQTASPSGRYLFLRTGVLFHRTLVGAVLTLLVLRTALILGTLALSVLCILCAMFVIFHIHAILSGFCKRGSVYAG